MPPLRLPRQEIHESLIEVHNRGVATPNFHKRWNDTQTALEGNADGVDASLAAVQAINAEQEQIILDLEDVVNEQAELLSEQIAINDRQDTQAGEIIEITDGLITAFEQQADFSAELAAQATDIIEALDVALEALADAEDAQDEITIIVARIVQKIRPNMSRFWGSASGTPDGSGHIVASYTYNWNASDWYNTPYMAGTAMVTPGTGPAFFHVRLITLSNSTITVQIVDADGAPITSGTYSFVFQINGVPTP